MRFRRKMHHNMALCCVLFPPPALLAAVQPSRRLQPAQASPSSCAVKYFPLTKHPFFAVLLVCPATFPPPPGVPHLPINAPLRRIRWALTRARALYRAMRPAINLSTRNVAQSFAQKFRADVPETHQRRKTFASKEREKTAFSPCGGIWGDGKKS